jgi:putative transcriptional regulator
MTRPIPHPLRDERQRAAILGEFSDRRHAADRRMWRGGHFRPKLAPMVRAPAKRLVRNDVRAWRCKRALTQEDLARQTGVTRQTIMNVEHGRTGPSIFLAYRIAAALDVPVTTLFRP